MHIILCSFPQISWFAQIWFLLGCLWSCSRAMWNKAKSHAWLLWLWQCSIEILWCEDLSSRRKRGHENFGAQWWSAGYRANTKETCYQRFATAFNLVCSSLQMLQEEKQILELSLGLSGKKYNVVILLEVERWFINCTCLQHPWEFPERPGVMARPRSALFKD